MQGLLFPYSCAASHSGFSHYWCFQNRSCSNSRLPAWFMQFSPGWHIRLKSGSPSACTEHSCSGSRTKTLGSSTSNLFSLICIGFRFATELALKSLRLLTGCSNFSSHPILLLSFRDMYRREHSARLRTSLSICVPTRKTTMAASKSFSSVASGIWNALPNHLSSVPTLPVFRRAIKHHLFPACLMLTLTVVQNLVWSNQLNVSHFVIQC